jgi:hypothetical protein
MQTLGSEIEWRRELATVTCGITDTSGLLPSAVAHRSTGALCHPLPGTQCTVQKKSDWEDLQKSRAFLQVRRAAVSLAAMLVDRAERRVLSPRRRRRQREAKDGPAFAEHRERTRTERNRPALNGMRRKSRLFLPLPLTNWTREEVDVAAGRVWARSCERTGARGRLGKRLRAKRRASTGTQGKSSQAHSEAEKAK